VSRLAVILVALAAFLKVHDSEARAVVSKLIELCDDPAINEPLFAQNPAPPPSPDIPDSSFAIITQALDEGLE
jgi:hypothetical protein